MPGTAPNDLPSAIGKYEVLARLGKGGMGELFLGHVTGEGGFNKLVALKRLHPHRAADTELVEMFMDEARISADLHHANIAQVFEFGRVENTYFIAMEYVEGVSLRRLRHYLGDRGELPPPTLTAYIVSSICAALDYAHGRVGAGGEPLNIVHRDVSPSNVLCSLEGEVKLIDFGIATAAERIHETTELVLKGKVAYMSPEQAAGDRLDRRSDIFSAGVILFELLTGQSPFRDDRSDTEHDLERLQQCRVQPPSALVGGLPPELERICLRALGRRPEQRYATAGQMQGELEAYCFEHHYGRRQFGQWMKETFQEEAECVRRVIRAEQRVAAVDAETASALDAAATRVLGPGVPARPRQLDEATRPVTERLEPATTVNPDLLEPATAGPQPVSPGGLDPATSGPRQRGPDDEAKTAIRAAGRAGDRLSARRWTIVGLFALLVSGAVLIAVLLTAPEPRSVEWRRGDAEVRRAAPDLAGPDLPRLPRDGGASPDLPGLVRDSGAGRLPPDLTQRPDRVKAKSGSPKRPVRRPRTPPETRGGDPENPPYRFKRRPHRW